MVEPAVVEDIYMTITGLLKEEYRVPGIENAFEPGKNCERWYAAALEAYWRLCDRLGVVDEDDDVEIIFNSFLDIQEELAKKMFAYGVQYGEKKPRR